MLHTLGWTSLEHRRATSYLFVDVGLSAVVLLASLSVYILEVFVGLHVIDALVAAFSRPMSRCTLTGFPLSLLLQHFAK